MTTQGERLAGLAVVITGANRGIGAAMAKGLAREGAAVAVNHPDAGTEPEARAVAEEICKSGGRAIAVRANVQAVAEHASLISAAQQEFGGLDVLINNAGVEYREPFLTTTEAQFDDTLHVNLRGAYFLSQAAARAMIQAGKGGRIINITSCHETVPLALRSAYSISKGGMAMLTKSLALELAEYGINVTAIAPGAILTDMNRESLSRSETLDRLRRTIPLNRVGSTEDCVGAAVFLASPEAAYITGTTLFVDGGLLLRKL